MIRAFLKHVVLIAILALAPAASSALADALAPHAYSICRRIHNQETCFLTTPSCKDGLIQRSPEAGGRKCPTVDKSACEGVEKWLRSTFELIERLPADQAKRDAGAYACDGYLITLPGKVAYACIGDHPRGALVLHDAFFAVEGACGP